MLHFTRLNTVLALSAAAVVVFVLDVFKWQRQRAQGFRSPPGPTPLPVVGNWFSIDPKSPWITYTNWKARYGDIFMIRVLKQDIIVISSEKIAKDLLGRRARIYSDRPHIATKEPFGWSFNLGFAPYGDRWRSQRRIFHQFFRAEESFRFHPIQLKKARQLILDILISPHDYHESIRKFAAAVIMSIVYDYDVSDHDYFMELLRRWLVPSLESMTIETASIVEAFPFVLRIPAWFPGGALARKAALCHQLSKKLIEEPFQYARKRKAIGSNASALALDFLERHEFVDDPSQLQILKDTCATALEAGVDTTSSALMYFMLAMVQHPKVQERAHAEIDIVVGDRPPTIDDRSSLPYLDAIMMEFLRMYTITPLGVPHAVTADDVYEDFFIPKGCTVVANVWAMFHDKAAYPEPYAFKPERFLVDGKLREDAKIIDNVVFGFGRRVCPGRYFADTSTWIGMVSILWAFNITKALDHEGKEIDFEPTFGYELTTAPHPFPCSITPRRENLTISTLLADDI